MSSRRRQRRVCARHKGYQTADDARYAMIRLSQNTGTRNLNTWKCKHCGKHHVGHMPGWLAEQRRQRQ